ncbi:hypothetical protein DV736_g4460, partial [Chaetothyriales sp. CBS 134916]
MVRFIGLEAVGWDDMHHGWWEKLLGGLLVASTVLGLLYLMYRVCILLRKTYNKRKNRKTIPPAVIRYLHELKGSTTQLASQKSTSHNPRTFGVYLGSFGATPSKAEIRLLSQWELIIVDPSQPGVYQALASSRSTQKVARIDVLAIIPPSSRRQEKDHLEHLTFVVQHIKSSFARSEEYGSSLTGVLIANWQSHFSPRVCNGLIHFADCLGLAVYLEMSPPSYMMEDEHKSLDLETVSGVVLRNATILPNGDRRNYYQMIEMLESLRSLARQSTIRPSIVMAWEVLDDAVQLDHAVAKRSFNWCRFNCAMSWIGPESALTDAQTAIERTIGGEPLGAMMFLKDDETVVLHDTWRFNDTISKSRIHDEAVYDRLDGLVPDLSDKLALLPARSSVDHPNVTVLPDNFDDSFRQQHASIDPLSVSPFGYTYTGLGCFQIGLECNPQDFLELVAGQKRLKELHILEKVKVDEIRKISNHLRALAGSVWTELPGVPEAVQSLVDLLEATSNTDNDEIRIWRGLHSGFQTSLDNQFHGLYDFDSTDGGIDIFLSAKAPDMALTIVHTFLSSRQFTHRQCLLAERDLSRQIGSLSVRWDLSTRVVEDVGKLSPTELIIFCQRLSSSQQEDTLDAKLWDCCKYYLMQMPTLLQLRSLNALAYIRGDVTAAQLVESRFAWYNDQGCQVPDLQSAISVFSEIDTTLSHMLIGRNDDILAQISRVLSEVLRKGQIDAAADILVLSIFCAFRRLALNETYLEVLDRNPLPNQHPDQAACFAEMFATGSRCDSYFDLKPNELGRILADRFRDYYAIHKPTRLDSVKEPLTSYASKQLDKDPDVRLKETPWYYNLTFLSTFALPAFIDITLLTTIGRGLYLTTYMTETEKSMATMALMISLFLCGATGTWIASGGSYYFFSMAFPTMNMYVVTRWIAGISVVLAGGIFALVIIAIVKGIYAAVIFFLYLVILTTYFSTLASLAVYQLPGFDFQSGRTAIIRCIPILFISPILTLFIGHDILVYLLVLGFFLSVLLFSARQNINAWSTWYLNIPLVSDNEIVKWYKDTQMAENSLPEYVTDVETTPIPRRALWSAIEAERKRPFWRKHTTDPLVLKLAKGFPATMFLLDWYCVYSRTEMPYKYSTTWNLQCKAAIDTLKSMQKGLKLHSAFVHWRHAGDEVYCGVLYFVIALMDKWVALLDGSSLVGLSAADSETFRLAVGFSLAYYLISAIALDSVATPLWATANKLAPNPVSTLEALRQVEINNARARRKTYWSNLVKFLFTHIWAVSVSSALLWTFQDSRDAVILYISYVGAYTGLLFYQYNRIYCGTAILPCTFIAAVVGLIVGPVLHHVLPKFNYSGVAALASASWTAAILSVRIAKIGWPKFKKVSGFHNSGQEAVYFSTSALNQNEEFSQTTLSNFVRAIEELPAESRHRLDSSTHPGSEVKCLLQFPVDGRLSNTAVFNSPEDIKQTAVRLWEQGIIAVDLVASADFLPEERTVKSICQIIGDKLRLFIFVSQYQVDGRGPINIRGNCRLVAECLLQATAEWKFDFTHEHSVLAELLVVDEDEQTGAYLPEGVKRQLAVSSERNTFVKQGNKILLRQLLLGIDCDTEWDTLALDVRDFLFKRCTGDSTTVSRRGLEWIQERSSVIGPSASEEHVARCNMLIDMTVAAILHAEALAEANTERYSTKTGASNFNNGQLQKVLLSTDHRPLMARIKAHILHFGQAIRVAMKFFVVSIVADPEFQRELDYVISGKPWFIRYPATFLLDGIWIFCKTLQQLLLPIVLIQSREKVSKLYKDMKGMQIVLERHRVTIDSAGIPTTCFFTREVDGIVQLHQYSGRHETEPKDYTCLLSLNRYTKDMILMEREEFSKGTSVNTWTYEYRHGGRGGDSKLPISRHCIKGALAGQLMQYDKRGYITSGSYFRDGNFTEFTWRYRDNAKFDDELLRAEFVLAHMTIKVSWSVPSRNSPKRLDKAIPNANVTQATFIQGPDVYHSKWTYDHKSHPIIDTTLNGYPVDTPAMIEHDWFDVLKKPVKCSFINDNPLLLFNTTTPSLISRILGTNKKWLPISTSLARAHLWKTWKSSQDVDAVTARWLDEWALRSDSILRPYWRARDLGRLTAACNYLNAHADTVMARVDMDPEISSWTWLAFKTSDLYTFGQGGDTCINTRSVSTQLRDSKSELHVLAMDTGTWPAEGGGVSACRRDMVNDLKTIRWHVIAESANDYGVPKFQVERNVQSLAVLPLWGLDFLTPSHGVLEKTLDAVIQERSHNTSAYDIKTKFLPILRTLVRCARAIKLDKHHIEDATNALLDLNTYFESGRHWSDIWMSDIVKQEWRRLWLCPDMENARPIEEWLNPEHPTIQHLDNALDMWQRYLFIFSLPVPERIPDVFQASHHFAGGSYGIVCKLKRGCTFHVWDHCISWREVNVFLSSSMSFDPPFVCTSLILLSRILSVLQLHHADVVLPCADFFNPGWEVELGSQEGTICHRKTYARKIDPVVNGICNMDKFKPIEKIKSEKPTAVMLSHVRFVKDIKNAILAADIIINEWGFTDYCLDIYGDMEKAPAYATECQEIIAAKGLSNSVVLRGLGSPTKVLETGWLFLNSSISEGLPLAMGEAALTGVPVVCTDVGASFRVVTEPETGKKFSACIAPNDSYLLAKAQVSILAMLDEWSEYADDPPGYRPKMPLKPTPEETKMIAARMYEKAPQRQRLGMKGRTQVMNSFSSERYLREHEQLLWIGKGMSPSFAMRSTPLVSAMSSAVWGESTVWCNCEDEKFLLGEKGGRCSRCNNM